MYTRNDIPVQHLERLDRLGLTNQFIFNRKNWPFMDDLSNKDFEDFIYTAFWWEETPEGHDFWHSVASSEYQPTPDHIQTGKSNPQWIPITEKLPEESQEVLTITAEGWYRLMTYGNTGSRFPSQVTHWMPLPEPPAK